MTGVLLIPCIGPMQSWGTRSRFQERDTEREPTKSGVIGVLCAALGRDRAEPLDDLTELVMGVRADREGTLDKDFQTAQGVLVAKGDSVQDLISNRHFIADGAFLVGLEGAMPVLEKAHAALASPVWPLFLGRKSHVPSEPFFHPDGLLPGVGLRQALLESPLLLGAWEFSRRLSRAAQERGGGRVRLVLESATVTHERRQDQPVCFAERRFRSRYVVTEHVDLSRFSLQKEDAHVHVAVGSR